MHPNYAFSAAPHLPFPLRPPLTNNEGPVRRDNTGSRRPMIELAGADNKDLILRKQ